MKNSKRIQNVNDGYEYVYDEETKRYVLQEGIDWEGGWNRYVAQPVKSAYETAKEATVKAFNKLVDDVKGIDFKKIINDMKQGVEDNILGPVRITFNDSKKVLEDGLNTTKDAMFKDVNEMVDGVKSSLSKIEDTVITIPKEISKNASKSFKNIGKKNEDLGKKLKLVGDGLEKIFRGSLAKAPVAVGKGLKRGLDDAGDLFAWVGGFIFSYLTCGIQYIENLHRCIFYYSLDVVGKLFYFPVTFVLWLSWEFGKTDLYDFHDKIWNTIYAIDKDFYGTFGFHFAHYPDNIKNMCYNCKRLKVVALKNKSDQINYDFDTYMPELLKDANKDISEGTTDFLKGFT